MNWLWLLVFSHPALAAKEIAETVPAPTGSSIDILHAILSANIIVQLTFVILIVMSIVSWAIIFQKWVVFKKIEKENSHLDDAFLKTSSFEEIYSICRSHEDSPLAQIFIHGYNEMKKILPQNSKKDDEDSTPPLITGIDNVERTLKKSIDNEVSFLESGLGFLATTGSSCPFIGLFGTVFGIMNSFSKIAAMGSASLNVVAPGIAEALVATGVGLFAAIPASIFYNTFLNKIKKQELNFNNFCTDFINIAKRNFFHETK